jgi:predicted methyltransferase
VIRQRLSLSLAAVLVLGGPAAFSQAVISAPIAAAVSDANRPQADRDSDARRKIAETVAFAGVEPGMKVVEIFPGKGYFTRVLAKTVGPKGRVYTIPWQEPDTGSSRNLAMNPAYGNITLWDGNLFGFKAGEPVDMLFTVQNYHDITSSQRPQVNQIVFKMLKPGGVYFIADHSARDGSGYNDLPLHRIDKALVIREVERAGFKLVGESDILHTPADDRTLNVFNPAIRGKTDQFLLKFVKP